MSTKPKCRFPNCGLQQSAKDQYAYYALPKDQPRRREWCERVGLDPNISLTYVYICGRHFPPEYAKRKTLPPDVFPLRRQISMESTVTCALCDSLGSNDGNFVPNTDEAKKNHARIHFTQLSKIIDVDDNGTAILEEEIYQRCCFTIRQPKLEHQQDTTCKLSSRQSCLDLCHQLFDKRHQSKSAITPKTVCNVCGVGISVTSRNMNPMIRHACAHLEVKLFKCLHCDGTTINSRYCIVRHIRTVHDIKEPSETDYEDKTNEYFDEIFNQIKRCYSTDCPRPSELHRRFVVKGGCRGNSNQSINDFCRSICIQRSMPATLECNLCGLVIASQKHFKAVVMYGHAAAHLEVKLFKCLHCDGSFSTTRAMKYHLMNAHQITDGKSGDDFEDLSEKYRSEHFDIIERCFSANPVKLEEPTTSRKDKGMTKVRGAVRKGTTDSKKLAVERNLLLMRLVKNRVDSDGKVKCALCSKRQVAKDSEGREAIAWAFQHVEAHLQKPLYRCNVCKSAHLTQDRVRQHLKKEHALALKKNYEHVGHEFHEEIMAMMSECYPAEGL